MTQKATDQFIDALEAEGREQLKEITAYRLYQGKNPDYAKRAKMALGVIGSYVRLRAANERSNELVAHRLISALPPRASAPVDLRQLKAGT